MVQDSDTCCPKGHRFFYATLAKFQTQGFNTTKFIPKESRPKESKPGKGKTSAPPHFKSTKLGKTFRIDKKKKYFKKKRDLKINTLATRDNANAVEGVEKKRNN